jgi:hypothetical protein
MKNVSIKKRARKNNNNKKYNKTQTKRSRRNKTQRINRRRRNFRNKTRRGGGPHGSSRLNEGINADGSAVPRVPDYRAARKSSRAPTNSNASIAARALKNPLASASAPFSRQQRRNRGPGALYMASRMASSRQQSYDPGSIDVDEVEEDISREIQRMRDEIDKEILKIEKLEEKNKKLQGEINGKQYLEASAKGKGIINARVGDQVRQNYGEIAEKKEKIDRLERLIKGNVDAVNNLPKNIANIINTSKIHKKEYGENTPRGQLIKKKEENDPDRKGTWRRTITSRIPTGISRLLFPTPGSITA